MLALFRGAAAAQVVAVVVVGVVVDLMCLDRTSRRPWVLVLGGLFFETYQPDIVT